MSSTAAPLAGAANGRYEADAKPEPALVTVPEARAASLPAEAGSLHGFGTFGLVVAAFSALPVWRMAELPHSADSGITTAIVFAGAAWHLWRDVRPRNETGVPALVASWALLVFTSWQLPWMPAEDFWFVRAALVLNTVALATLWCGVVRGWRAIAAVAIWALWLHHAVWLEEALSTYWVCKQTAAIAGWLLWQLGVDLSVSGNHLHTASGLVLVGNPCTGVPLASVLAVLLIAAALVLRLSWWIALRLLLICGAVAFLVGVVRVAILVMMVPVPERFDYWHSPDGAAWFTAAAMLALAWLISREMSRVAKPVAAIPVMFVPVGLSRAAWMIAAVAGVALLASDAPERQQRARETIPSWPGAWVERSGTRSAALAARPYDQFAWEQEASYVTPDGTRLEVVFASVPLMLGGDARELSDAPEWVREKRTWTRQRVAPDAEMWAFLEGTPGVAVVALAPDGRAITDLATWRGTYVSALREPERWWQWLMHQRAMCDKSAFFLGFRWEAAQGNAAASEALIAAAFAAWRQHAISVSALRRGIPQRHADRTPE